MGDAATALPLSANGVHESAAATGAASTRIGDPHVARAAEEEEGEDEDEEGSSWKTAAWTLPRMRTARRS